MSLGLRFFSLLLNSYFTLECICIFRGLRFYMQYLQLTARCTAHCMWSFNCLLSSSCCARASTSLPSTMCMFPELLAGSLHTWPRRAEQAPRYHHRVLCHVLDYPYLPQSSFLEGKLRLQGSCCQAPGQGQACLEVQAASPVEQLLAAKETGKPTEDGLAASHSVGEKPNTVC